MSNAGTECLDLEDLAAFADRRLSGAERQRAVEHLADCERCYEIYAEVVSLQEEEARTEAPPAMVVGHPRARSWLWPAGALAAAALLVLVVAPFLRDGDYPLPDPGWDQHGWTTYRGGSLWGPEETAFRLGVLTVDLEVALEAGRAVAARSHSAGIAGLLGGLDLFAPQQLLFEEMSLELRDGKPPADLIDDAEAAEELLVDYVAPPPYYALGRWVEEGRAAALVGNHRFFASRQTRRSLDRFESFELSPDVSEKLDEIRALIVGKPTDDDLVAVEKALDEIITRGGVREGNIR